MSRATGRVIVLNGAPRAGKSSIALAVQANLPGDWLIIGVDAFMNVLPSHLRPGVGLRPDRNRPETQRTVEDAVPGLFRAAYATIAAHAREGFDVVADFGHHDAYSRRLNLLPQCARQLEGLEAWLIGVTCPIEDIVQRRIDAGYEATGGVDNPWVRAWQAEVHSPGVYDLTVDTGRASPAECAELIQRRMAHGAPWAFRSLASR